MDYFEIYEKWLKNADKETVDEIKSIDANEIEDRFYKDLEFGTGGLRGLMGAGSNRMNKYTVRRATQGLADELSESEKGGGTNIKMAVIDQNDIVYKSSFKTEKSEEKIISSLTEKIINLKNSLDITTVGIGTPGIIKEGKVTATNLPFKDTPLKKLIKTDVRLEISTLQNDAGSLGAAML